MPRSTATLIVTAAALAGVVLLLLAARPDRAPEATPGEGSKAVSSTIGNPPHADAPAQSSISAAARQPTLNSRPVVADVREGFRAVLEAEAKRSARQDDDAAAAASDTETASADTVFPHQPTPPSEGNATAAVGISSPGSSEDPAAGGLPVVTAETRLWLPAAMLEPDPSIPISTELQVAEWERLQDLFVRAVDGRAPGDLESREVWVRAQQDSDDRFRQKFGWDAFRAQQLKAYREGLAPQL